MFISAFMFRINNCWMIHIDINKKYYQRAENTYDDISAQFLYGM